MNMHSYTVQEASDQLSVPRNQVSYLCRKGYIPYLQRNHLGARIINEAQLELIRQLLKMRQAGFRPKELRQYSRLYRQGPSTESARLAMLTTRKHQLRQEILDRQKAVDFIERQEELYQQKQEEQ